MVELDGQPWFVAADIIKCLSIPNPTNAYKRLAEAEVTNIRRAEVGMTAGRDAKLITESGLYKLIMRSNKPEAREFQDWVTRVVLPAIRKDGGYIKGEEKVSTGEMSEDELVLLTEGQRTEGTQFSVIEKLEIEYVGRTTESVLPSRLLLL